MNSLRLLLLYMACTLCFSAKIFGKVKIPENINDTNIPNGLYNSSNYHNIVIKIRENWIKDILQLMKPRKTMSKENNVDAKDAPKVYTNMFTTRTGMKVIKYCITNKKKLACLEVVYRKRQYNHPIRVRIRRDTSQDGGVQFLGDRFPEAEDNSIPVDYVGEQFHGPTVSPTDFSTRGISLDNAIPRTSDIINSGSGTRSLLKRISRIGGGAHPQNDSGKIKEAYGDRNDGGYSIHGYDDEQYDGNGEDNERNHKLSKGIPKVQEEHSKSDDESERKYDLKNFQNVGDSNSAIRESYEDYDDGKKSQGKKSANGDGRKSNRRESGVNQSSRVKGDKDDDIRKGESLAGCYDDIKKGVNSKDGMRKRDRYCGGKHSDGQRKKKRKDVTRKKYEATYGKRSSGQELKVTEGRKGYVKEFVTSRSKRVQDENGDKGENDDVDYEDFLSEGRHKDGLRRKDENTDRKRSDQRKKNTIGHNSNVKQFVRNRSKRIEDENGDKRKNDGVDYEDFHSEGNFEGGMRKKGKDTNGKHSGCQGERKRKGGIRKKDEDYNGNRSGGQKKKSTNGRKNDVKPSVVYKRNQANSEDGTGYKNVNYDGGSSGEQEMKDRNREISHTEHRKPPALIYGHRFQRNLNEYETEKQYHKNDEYTDYQNEDHSSDGTNFNREISGEQAKRNRNREDDHKKHEGQPVVNKSYRFQEGSNAEEKTKYQNYPTFQEDERDEREISEEERNAGQGKKNTKREDDRKKHEGQPVVNKRYRFQEGSNAEGKIKHQKYQTFQDNDQEDERDEHEISEEEHSDGQGKKSTNREDDSKKHEGQPVVNKSYRFLEGSNAEGKIKHQNYQTFQDKDQEDERDEHEISEEEHSDGQGKKSTKREDDRKKHEGQPVVNKSYRFQEGSNAEGKIKHQNYQTFQDDDQKNERDVHEKSEEERSGEIESEGIDNDNGEDGHRSHSKQPQVSKSFNTGMDDDGDEAAFFPDAEPFRTHPSNDGNENYIRVRRSVQSEDEDESEAEPGDDYEMFEDESEQEVWTKSGKEIRQELKADRKRDLKRVLKKVDYDVLGRGKHIETNRDPRLSRIGNGNIIVLYRRARGIRRGKPGIHFYRKPCKLPPPSKTLEVLCKRFPSKVVCNLYCVKGHTLKEGIFRKVRCSYETGRWSHAFDECKPFTDCTLKLYSAGSLSCETNTVRDTFNCNVSCHRAGPHQAVRRGIYRCDAQGHWHPILPHCVIREGIDLVDPPIVTQHKKIVYP